MAHGHCSVPIEPGGQFEWAEEAKTPTSYSHEHLWFIRASLAGTLSFQERMASILQPHVAPHFV